MIRSILLAAMVIAIWCVAVRTQSLQDQPQRYSYHVWGAVLDEQGNPFPDASVWFIPATRPLMGRLASTRTDREGNYALTTKDIPDSYIICASKTDSPWVPFQKEPKSTDSSREKTVTCSGPLRFGAGDDCKKVDFKFEAK